MHTCFLVTFKKEDAKTPDEARGYVNSYLMENNFCGNETRWGCGPSDWYVIGGRWSGTLVRARLDEDTLEALDKEFGEKYGWWLGGEERVTEEQRRAQYREMFTAAFPDFTGELPRWRDEYREDGYEDDAAIVDEVLYDRLLQEFEGSTEDDYHADLDYEEVSRDFIGRKWIVVVDYHS